MQREGQPSRPAAWGVALVVSILRVIIAVCICGAGVYAGFAYDKPFPVRPNNLDLILRLCPGAMNEAQKRLKAQWRDQQRKAALPLLIPELRAMFDMLDVEVPCQGCDHTRRLTRAWRASRGHDVERVFAWLDSQGGYCDCEILANVEEKLDDAIKTEA